MRVSLLITSFSLLPPLSLLFVAYVCAPSFCRPRKKAPNEGCCGAFRSSHIHVSPLLSFFYHRLSSLLIRRRSHRIYLPFRRLLLYVSSHQKSSTVQKSSTLVTEWVNILSRLFHYTQRANERYDFLDLESSSFSYQTSLNHHSSVMMWVAVNLTSIDAHFSGKFKVHRPPRRSTQTISAARIQTLSLVSSAVTAWKITLILIETKVNFDYCVLLTIIKLICR